MIFCAFLLFFSNKIYSWNFYLIWNFDLVPVAVVFTLLGVGVRKYLLKLEKFFAIYYLPVALLLTIFVGRLNYHWSGKQIVDLYYQQIGNHLLFYIAAISGIWSTLIFFKSIPEMTLLKSIGQRTLIYYGVHAPIVLVLVEKLVLQLSTRYTGIFVNGYVTTSVVAILTLVGCESIVRVFRGTNFPFGFKRLGDKDE